MKVTIPICTWNRARLLDATLECLTALEIPDDVELSVLVVDNNSTDTTADVVSRHASRLALNYLFEPTPGKSHALNRAVEAVDSDWMFFVDDDVLVARDWLANYCRAIACHRNAAFLGGPIRPRFEESPPAWLTEVLPDVGGAFAMREFGDRSFRLDSTRLPFGANFAIRTDVQKQFPYDTNLGRRADGMLAGEETALFEQLLERGAEGYWVPDAAVEHVITADRMSEFYLRQFFAGIGATQMVRSRRPALRGPARWWHWGRAIYSETRFQITRRVARPRTWVRALSRASHRWARLGHVEGAPRGWSLPATRRLAGQPLHLDN